MNQDAFLLLLKDMARSERNIVSQAGNSLEGLLQNKGKVGQSILATALEQTAVWAYERVHKATYKKASDDLEPAPNDFTFSQMRDGNTSIYLIIPPDYLTEYRAVLRVMIGFAMRELRVSFTELKKYQQYKDKPPVLFILDEFPQLAYMRPIEEALLYLAGYDVRLWFFVQDISQLQLHYKDTWRTFFANTGTQCFFGVSDIATAKLVSEMVGITTIEHLTLTQGSSNSNILEPYTNPLNSPRTTSSTTRSESTTHASRPLMTPDEVMRMPDTEQIIFMKGLKPIRCHRPNYYDFPELDADSKISLTRVVKKITVEKREIISTKTINP
ncbi:MAG: type IV secretory system conjugative DNA transfer family protein [Methylomicrobium sp.]